MLRDFKVWIHGILTGHAWYHGRVYHHEGIRHCALVCTYCGRRFYEEWTRLDYLISALLFALIFWLSMSAANAACAPVINTVSYHLNREANYNENNFGFGVECEQWQVGTYRNSLYAQSFYAVRKFDTGRVGPFAVGFVAGAVSGYPSAPVVPMAALTLTRQTWRLLITPPVKYRDENLGLIAVQMIVPVNF